MQCYNEPLYIRPIVGIIQSKMLQADGMGYTNKIHLRFVNKQSTHWYLTVNEPLSIFNAEGPQEEICTKILSEMYQEIELMHRRPPGTRSR